MRHSRKNMIEVSLLLRSSPDFTFTYQNLLIRYLKIRLPTYQCFPSKDPTQDQTSKLHDLKTILKILMNLRKSTSKYIQIPLKSVKRRYFILTSFLLALIIFLATTSTYNPIGKAFYYQILKNSINPRITLSIVHQECSIYYGPQLTFSRPYSEPYHMSVPKSSNSDHI